MATCVAKKLVFNISVSLENVVCEDNREARSIQTTVKTSISKEKSSFHTRNTKNNDETVTYARTY